MTIKKFAGIVDGDIFSILTIDSEFSTNEDSSAGERLIAGFQSDPKIIEIPSDLDVKVGWTWDGNNFIEG
jgi:hypothetical protein